MRPSTSTQLLKKSEQARPSTSKQVQTKFFPCKIISLKTTDKSSQFDGRVQTAKPKSASIQKSQSQIFKAVPKIEKLLDCNARLNYYGVFQVNRSTSVKNLTINKFIKSKTQYIYNNLIADKYMPESQQKIVENVNKKTQQRRLSLDRYSDSTTFCSNTDLDSRLFNTYTNKRLQMGEHKQEIQENTEISRNQVQNFFHTSFANKQVKTRLFSGHDRGINNKNNNNVRKIKLKTNKSNNIEESNKISKQFKTPSPLIHIEFDVLATIPDYHFQNNYYDVHQHMLSNNCFPYTVKTGSERQPKWKHLFNNLSKQSSMHLKQNEKELNSQSERQQIQSNTQSSQQPLVTIISKESQEQPSSQLKQQESIIRIQENQFQNSNPQNEQCISKIQKQQQCAIKIEDNQLKSSEKQNQIINKSESIQKEVVKLNETQSQLRIVTQNQEQGPLVKRVGYDQQKIQVKINQEELSVNQINQLDNQKQQSTKHENNNSQSKFFMRNTTGVRTNEGINTNQPLAQQDLSQSVIIMTPTKIYENEATQKLAMSIKKKNPNLSKYIDQMYIKYKQQQRPLIKQTGLNTSEDKEPLIKVDQELINDILTSFNRLNRQFENIVQQSNLLFQKKEPFDSWLQAGQGILSEQELTFVRKEFTKQQNDIDYYTLDSILKKLKFFQKYTLTTRLNLMRVSKYMAMKAGEIVFRQGDTGDLMYIILHGSVNVRIQKKIEEGYIEDTIVAVLYDGFNFGELAMMKTTSTRNEKQINTQMHINAESLNFIRQELKKHEQLAEFENEARRRGYKKEEITKYVEEYKEKLERDQKIQEEYLNSNKKQQKTETTKRAATIQVSEDCEFLAITKDNFNSILMELMQDELDIKIKLLNTLHLFDCFQPFALIPIANVLKLEKYGINDVVLKQGQPLEKFYIVAQGRCKIIKIEKIIRSNSPTLYARNLKKKLKKFSFDLSQGSEIKSLIPEIKGLQEQGQDANMLLDHPLRNPKLENTDTIFDYEKYQQCCKGLVSYNKFEEYGKLSQGDFFGGRALTGKKIKNQKSDIAQLSVIADTNDLELYTLTKDKLIFLPEFLKNYLLSQLEVAKEFDEIDSQKESKLNQLWNKQKDKICQDYIFDLWVKRGNLEFKDF